MNQLKINGIYRHYKGDYYLVLDTAINTETNEAMVVYRALYEDTKLYVRPLDMFLSELDKESKYNEKYRFELQDIPSIKKLSK